MQIVPQSASFSLTSVPMFPLLAAPTPRLMLTAPKIAGLLPATVPLHGEVIIDKPRTWADILQELGPIRTREEMNAEIAALMGYFPNTRGKLS